MRMDPKRAWRHKSDNQNPYIEEQTTQWPKEKVQKDKQRSTKHTKCFSNLPLPVKKTNGFKSKYFTISRSAQQ